MSQEKTIYAKLEEELLNLALTEKQKNKLLKKLQLLRENKLNIMLVGATGCGKSSTINALFNCAELQVADAQGSDADESNRKRLHMPDRFPGAADQGNRREKNGGGIFRRLGRSCHYRHLRGR